MKPVVAAVSALAVALVLILGGAFGIAAFGSTCGTGIVDPQRASKLEPVNGYSGDQLAYAAAILNAVTATGVDPRAGAIAITAAIARSGLRNLDTGDDLREMATSLDFDRARAPATAKVLKTFLAESP